MGVLGLEPGIAQDERSSTGRNQQETDELHVFPNLHLDVDGVMPDWKGLEWVAVDRHDSDTSVKDLHWNPQFLDELVVNEVLCCTGVEKCLIGVVCVVMSELDWKQKTGRTGRARQIPPRFTWPARFPAAVGTGGGGVWATRSRQRGPHGTFGPAPLERDVPAFWVPLVLWVLGERQHSFIRCVWEERATQE